MLTEEVLGDISIALQTGRGRTTRFGVLELPLGIGEAIRKTRICVAWLRRSEAPRP